DGIAVDAAGHVYVTGRVDGDAVRLVELARRGAGGAPGGREPEAGERGRGREKRDGGGGTKGDGDAGDGATLCAAAVRVNAAAAGARRPADATLTSTASQVQVASATWTQTISDGRPVSYWTKPTTPWAASSRHSAVRAFR